MKRLRLLLLTLVIGCTVLAFQSSSPFGGTFYIYTKSQICELTKTQAVFRPDHSFRFHTTCNGHFSERFGKMNKMGMGRWHLLNDSTIIVCFPTRDLLRFKILSDSLIELQKEQVFNKPIYKKE